jgi:hypothetical protein
MIGSSNSWTPPQASSSENRQDIGGFEFTYLFN